MLTEEALEAVVAIIEYIEGPEFAELQRVATALKE
jgi:hypothetical protein